MNRRLDIRQPLWHSLSWYGLGLSATPGPVAVYPRLVLSGRQRASRQ